MEAGGQMGTCDHCVFWKMARPSEGWCLRRAPKAAGEADRIAHWPTTHGQQGCGEFMAAGSAVHMVACADCGYWCSPSQGLQPVDRGDKLLSWWAHAGQCRRHAPQPQSEPGPRGFWRATHATNSCAEGIPRAHGAQE